MYLDWKTDGRDYYAIDIETDDLDATVVWVMCWENIKTGETGVCTDYGQMVSFLGGNKSAVFVTHNGLKFDCPVLNRLVGSRLSVNNVCDTLVLSTLYHPSIPDGHSLEAWGKRIGLYKGEFNDWSHLSQEMIEYCQQDVKVTAELFRRLTNVLRKIGFSELTCYIQHHITVILERQRKNGFYFDGPRALAFYAQLRHRESQVAEDIRRAFPADLVERRVGQIRTKQAELTAIFRRDRERYIIHEIGDGTYRASEEVQFNIGSPPQRVAKLLELGWEPEEFTPKTDKGGGGNPKPFDKGKMSPSLERFLESNPNEQVKLIGDWMQINGRANMVNTWLEAWNEDDSCIHGNLFVADTLRFRHQAPNTANIPAVRTDKSGSVLTGESGYYTYEARDLWCARPGRVLVGTDAAGLELRMLAHYLNRGDFTEQVVNGDPHQFNADLVGISRASAKTLIYATLYGASGGKVGKTLNVSTKEGARIRELFLDRLGVGPLMDDCKAEQEKGRVWLIDGAGVICPSPHAALNYKLQGGGSRLMSLACVRLTQHIKVKGLDSLLVGSIHDEMQYDVAPGDAEEHGKVAIQSIIEAGEELGIRVPMDGTSKSGLTWSQTH